MKTASTLFSSLGIQVFQSVGNTDRTTISLWHRSAEGFGRKLVVFALHSNLHPLAAGPCKSPRKHYSLTLLTLELGVHNLKEERAKLDCHSV